MARSKLFRGIGWNTMKEFLDEKVELYNNPSFIEADPISIPHRFESLHDREIPAFSRQP
jgi:hypothetical protein